MNRNILWGVAAICLLTWMPFMVIGCGALWPTEPSAVQIDVDDNEGTVIIDISDDDVLVGTNGPTGDITINTGDEESCCEEDSPIIEDGRCWSSCESKNLLPVEQCEACSRGERSCVWPWEVDAECLSK